MVYYIWKALSGQSKYPYQTPEHTAPVINITNVNSTCYGLAITILIVHLVFIILHVVTRHRVGYIRNGHG